MRIGKNTLHRLISPFRRSGCKLTHARPGNSLPVEFVGQEPQADIRVGKCAIYPPHGFELFLIVAENENNSIRLGFSDWSRAAILRQCLAALILYQPAKSVWRWSAV